jgi:hypothetical protein
MKQVAVLRKHIDLQRNKQRYIPENTTLHNHRCENLNYYKNLP